MESITWRWEELSCRTGGGGGSKLVNWRLVGDCGGGGGGGRDVVGCDNGEIMHMVLEAFPSAPCIINSFLGLRFMKSRR